MPMPMLFFTVNAKETGYFCTELDLRMALWGFPK